MNTNDTGYSDENKKYSIMYDLRLKSLNYRYNLDPSRVCLIGRKIILSFTDSGEIIMLIEENKNVIRRFRYKYI